MMFFIFILQFYKLGIINLHILFLNFLNSFFKSFFLLSPLILNQFYRINFLIFLQLFSFFWYYLIYLCFYYLLINFNWFFTYFLDIINLFTRHIINLITLLLWILFLIIMFYWTLVSFILKVLLFLCCC
jgi:hypothetical protein